MCLTGFEYTPTIILCVSKIQQLAHDVFEKDSEHTSAKENLLPKVSLLILSYHTKLYRFQKVI